MFVLHNQLLNALEATDLKMYTVSKINGGSVPGHRSQKPLSFTGGLAAVKTHDVVTFCWKCYYITESVSQGSDCSSRL